MKRIRSFIETHQLNDLGQPMDRRSKAIPILTPEQNQLVLDNLPNLAKCMKGDPRIRWAVRFYDSWEDAFTVGVLAMMKAATKFESSRGLQFWTYAYWWVRQKLTRPPVGSSAGLMISEKPQNKWRKRKWLNRADLDAKYDEGARGIEAIGYTDETADDRDRQATAKKRVDIIRTLLNPRHFDVLMLRANGKTLDEIGQELGISRERVRQIERRARDILTLRIRTWQRTHGRVFPVGD